MGAGLTAAAGTFTGLHAHMITIQNNDRLATVQPGVADGLLMCSGWFLWYVHVGGLVTRPEPSAGMAMTH